MKKKIFKDIVGVGMFNLLAKGDAELVDGLNFMKTKHDEALLLNDPTGDIVRWMDSNQLEADDDEEINTIWGLDTASTTGGFEASSYFNQT